MTFTIDKTKTGRDAQYLLVEINEEAKHNESYGDVIGIQKDDKTLWFDDNIDLKDKGVRDFIDNFFTDAIDVALYINEKTL